MLYVTVKLWIKSQFILDNLEISAKTVLTLSLFHNNYDQITFYTLLQELFYRFPSSWIDWSCGTSETSAALEPMRNGEGLKRTIIAQGWKSDSLNDQLGQKLSWDVSGFNGFHRAALIQACRHQAKHRISKQRSPFNYYTCKCLCRSAHM